MLAFEDWLSGDVSSSHSQTQRNSTNSMGSSSTMHNNQASGAAAIEDARANISAKSLHKEADREKMRKDAAADAKLTREVVRNFAVSLVHHKILLEVGLRKEQESKIWHDMVSNRGNCRLCIEFGRVQVV